MKSLFIKYSKQTWDRRRRERESQKRRRRRPKYIQHAHDGTKNREREWEYSNKSISKRHLRALYTLHACLPRNCLIFHKWQLCSTPMLEETKNVWTKKKDKSGKFERLFMLILSSMPARISLALWRFKQFKYIGRFAMVKKVPHLLNEVFQSSSILWIVWREHAVFRISNYFLRRLPTLSTSG
jgi:hypothetical protein